MAERRAGEDGEKETKGDGEGSPGECQARGREGAEGCLEGRARLRR